ncbi:hypothetical protein [Petrachloros mirabilis]
MSNERKGAEIEQVLPPDITHPGAGLGTDIAGGPKSVEALRR